MRQVKPAAFFFMEEVTYENNNNGYKPSTIQKSC